MPGDPLKEYPTAFEVALITLCDLEEPGAYRYWEENYSEHMWLECLCNVARRAKRRRQGQLQVMSDDPQRITDNRTIRISLRTPEKLGLSARDALIQTLQEKEHLSPGEKHLLEIEVKMKEQQQRKQEKETQESMYVRPSQYPENILHYYSKWLNRKLWTLEEALLLVTGQVGHNGDVIRECLAVELV